ncbi:hypothetical protein [Algoriphagus namhaensis]
MEKLSEKELVQIYGGSGTEGMNTIQKGYYYFTYAVGYAKGWLDSIIDYELPYGDSLPIENKA